MVYKCLKDGQYCTLNSSSFSPSSHPYLSSTIGVHTRSKRLSLLTMTSHYALHQQVSNRTHEAYLQCGDHPRDLNDRLNFYILFLKDVVPYDITVHHVPRDRNPRLPHREEICLLTRSGKIFMTGLISLGTQTKYVQDQAAGEAYTRWLRRQFVDGNWRFFTGLMRMTFCNGFDNNEWEQVVERHPEDYAREIARYLQQEYDRLVHH